MADLGRKSVRRNAPIADLLHRIDFIEKAGTGVIRIRDEAREGGYPERRRPIILSERDAESVEVVAEFVTVLRSI